MTRRILIIGASSGIGMCVARDFAAMGMKVAVAARREAPLRALADEFPDNVIFDTIDVTRRDAPERLLALIQRNGGMDTLLMASGVGYQNPELDLERETVTLETNVTGWARLVATAYRYFRDNHSADTPAQIAAITSVASTRGIGVAASYSASKRFQREYLIALRQLAHKQHLNLTVTDIRPGFIRTPLLDPGQDYPLLMTLDYAVPLIELAILRRSHTATVDWRWRLLCAAWRCIPTCWWTKMDIHN